MTPPPAPLPRSKTMDTQTIQHYEDTISRLRQELSQSPNSRQARRERFLCAILSNTLGFDDMTDQMKVELADKFVTLSDGLDEWEGK